MDPPELDAAILAYQDAGDFDRALLAAGRNRGPELLYRWWLDGKVEGDQLRAQLPEVWSGAEWPESYLDREAWLEMFGDAGYLSDDPEYPSPQEMIVFRGAAPRRRLGMSWTLDPDKAEWFARRFGSRGAKVYQAIAPPEAVLAVITTIRAGEAEVVVDPSWLHRVHIVRRPG